jgi:hypothetical protein
MLGMRGSQRGAPDLGLWPHCLAVLKTILSHGPCILAVFLGAHDGTERRLFQQMHLSNELLRCLPRDAWPVVRSFRAASTSELPELAATRAIVFHNVSFAEAGCVAVQSYL